MNSIGTIRSPYRERFGIPRQPGLVGEARARVELEDSPAMRDALRGLEEFSHVWVIFVFHDTENEGWNPLVRPPRLGGARKVGVFASRSPHRPNPIGLSAVRLERVEGHVLHIAGADLLDGTPVLDIKPYIPYADAIPGAEAGWASESPAPTMRVEFAPAALEACLRAETAGVAGLRALIEQTLALDPRPAFQARETSGEFGMRLLDFDVRWRIEGEVAVVTELADLTGASQ